MPSRTGLPSLKHTGLGVLDCFLPCLEPAILPQHEVATFAVVTSQFQSHILREVFLITLPEGMIPHISVNHSPV